MIRKRKNKDLEDFKYLIDSRTLTDKERKEEKEAILKAREARFKERSEQEVKIAKLMQLKYQMEDYVNNPKCDLERNFTRFLAAYVDTVYDKRKNFATDLSIKPMVLSQVLNNHREPQSTFILRLIVHSEELYKNLCAFDKELWPRIYYQDKVCEIFSTQDKWRKSEEKFVNKRKLEIEK